MNNHIIIKYTTILSTIRKNGTCKWFYSLTKKDSYHLYQIFLRKNEWTLLTHSIQKSYPRRMEYCWWRQSLCEIVWANIHWSFPFNDLIYNVISLCLNEFKRRIIFCTSTGVSLVSILCRFDSGTAVLGSTISILFNWLIQFWISAGNCDETCFHQLDELNEFLKNCWTAITKEFFLFMKQIISSSYCPDVANRIPNRMNSKTLLPCSLARLLVYGLPK